MADEPNPDSLLGQFFARQIAPPVPPPPTGPQLASQREAYLAFDGKDKQERVLIHAGDGVTYALAYGPHLSLLYNRRTYEEITLSQGHLTFLVQGQRLEPICSALVNGHCRFMAEYNTWEHLQPTDPSAPFIQSIAVIDARYLDPRPERGQEAK